MFATLVVFQARIPLIATADLTSGCYAIIMGDVQLVTSKNEDGHNIFKTTKSPNKTTIWTVAVGTNMANGIICIFHDKDEPYMALNFPSSLNCNIFMNMSQTAKDFPSAIALAIGCSEERGLWTFTAK
ncbi:hypothetical protein EC957_002535 [Mortierella hygrophila]|uniref:Uncharacterized protein n=1 Tax=Mortierella hygrophila TaxID=979708 RepID=A0A9P6K1W2_9FUNG|nr:hypothetical protein EC957_002535 [Mortierella hygrophila]